MMQKHSKGRFNKSRLKGKTPEILILLHYNSFIKIAKKEDKRLSKQFVHCLLMIYFYKDLGFQVLYTYYSYYKLEHYINFLIKFEYIEQREKTGKTGKVYVYYVCTNRGNYIVDKLAKEVNLFLADLRKQIDEQDASE